MYPNPHHTQNIFSRFLDLMHDKRGISKRRDVVYMPLQ